MYIAFYLLVLFAATAMMVQQGVWSNAISLINIIISGLVAFSFYQPLAIYVDEMLDGEYTYLVDFVVIWALFVVTMLVCRLISGLASTTRMRFKHPIDPIGGPLVGLIAAWVLAGIVLASLHTSPMPKSAFGGSLIYSASDVDSTSGLFNPDLGWLRFVEHVTKADAFGHSGGSGFSAKAFVQIYADHREKFEKANASWIRVRRG
jgi:uncharacterized membrane protein required for colicin V production